MRDWIKALRNGRGVRYVLEHGQFPEVLVDWFVWDVAEHAIRVANKHGIYFNSLPREGLAAKKMWILEPRTDRGLYILRRENYQYSMKLHEAHVSEPHSAERELMYWVAYAVSLSLATETVYLPDACGWCEDLPVEAEVQNWHRRRLIYLLEVWQEFQDRELFINHLRNENIIQWENPTGKIAGMSLRPPHGDLIMMLHKSIEGRTKNTPYRGPVIIHASASNPAVVAEHIRLYQSQGKASQTPWLSPPLPSHYEPSRGVALGTAQLINSRPMIPSDVPYAFYPYCWPIDKLKAWVLADVQPFKEPVPMKGFLGVYRVDWPLTQP